MCDHAHSIGNVSSGIFQTLDELEFEKSIFSAALNGEVQRVRLLIAKDEELAKSADSYGYTALHYAARAGHLEICLALLGAGADVDAPTVEGGQTALHRAAFCGHRAVVEKLLEAGANTSAVDADGETALHKAYKMSQDTVVSLLRSMMDPECLELRNRHGKLAQEMSGAQ